jgi:hypothetical protein
MKSSHGQSTTSTLLVALLALTFGCHAVSTLAQAKGRYCGEKTASIISKIDVPAVTAFQNAWRIAGNGHDRFEALVLLYWKADGSILARTEGRSGEHNSFTFGWTSNIIAVVHTHPNSVDPRPAGLDLQVADKFGVPVFTLTKRGMYVYDPDTRRTSMVKDGLDWLQSSKWDSDRSVVAQRP